MRTRIIYHGDGRKTVLGAVALTKESYEAATGGDKDFHAHLLDCNKRAEAAGELDRMSHRERQYIKDVHTHAQQPGYWPKEQIYAEH